jgi:class 3 adenylate cyclase
LGLGKYTRTFAKQEIDFDLLPQLTERDVRELRLPIGPRRRLLNALARLRGGTESQTDGAEFAIDAERRQLAVMFVDLAGSTRLALRLDPEAMRELLRAFRDTVSGEIARSGYVAKLMGDGVLAYFGWPQAHEDDASRAVAAALAITDAVGRLDGPVGEKLACRIEIATGMVVVGDVIGEGAARECAVVGPTPNLAARLQEVAEPGEIMIADTTRRLLGSGFAVESIGERLSRTLKHQPVGALIGRRFGDRLNQARLPDPRLARQQHGVATSRFHFLPGTPECGQFRFTSAPSRKPFWPILQQLPSACSSCADFVGLGEFDRRAATLWSIASKVHPPSTADGPRIVFSTQQNSRQRYRQHKTGAPISFRLQGPERRGRPRPLRASARPDEDASTDPEIRSLPVSDPPLEASRIP